MTESSKKYLLFLEILTAIIVSGCGNPETLNGINSVVENNAFKSVVGSGNVIVKNIKLFGFDPIKHTFAISRYSTIEELATINASTSFTISGITTGSITQGDSLYLDRINYTSTGQAIHSGLGYKFPAPGPSENIVFDQINIIPWVTYKEGYLFDIDSLTISNNALLWDFRFVGTNGNNQYIFDSISENITQQQTRILPGYTVPAAKLTTTVNNLARNNYSLIFRSRQVCYGYLTPQTVYNDNGEYLYSAFIYYYPDGQKTF